MKSSKKEQEKQRTFVVDPYSHYYDVFENDTDDDELRLDGRTSDIKADPEKLAAYFESQLEEAKKTKKEWVFEAMKKDPAFMADPIKDYYSMLIPPEWKSRLTAEQYEEIIAIFDPVTWAKKYLYQKHGGWKPRCSKDGKPYQSQMIRCKSKRIVARAGRRLGKSISLIVRILHKAFTWSPSETKSVFNVIIFTPNQAQIDLLFKMMEVLIDGNPKLMQMVVNGKVPTRKSPFYQLDLTNGVCVKGFVSGSAAIRGQASDMLVLDEGSFLTKEDTDAVVSLMAENKQAECWVSSTPKGLKDWFYERVHDPDFVSFYFPSDEYHPDWDAQMENEFRKQLTSAGYEHEIRACLEKDTLIKTTNGDKPIQSITTEDKLYDHNGNVINVIVPAFENGTRDIYKYTTSAGVFMCTDDHSFPDINYTKKPIQSLDRVPVYNIPQYGSEDKNKTLARICGYLIGDGNICSTRTQASVYSSNKIDMINMQKDLRSIWPEKDFKIISDISRGHSDRLVKVDGERHTINIYGDQCNELINLGIPRGKKAHKTFDVPRFIKQGSNIVKASFLSGLFGAEGSTPRNGKNYSCNSIRLSMSKYNKDDGHLFFTSLVQLMQDVGVGSNYTVGERHYNGRKYYTFDLYTARSMQEAIDFYSIVGYKYAYEKETLSFRRYHHLVHYMFDIKKKQDIYNLINLLYASGHGRTSIARNLGVAKHYVDHAIERGSVSRLYCTDLFPKFNEWVSDRIDSNDESMLFVDILSSEYIKTEIVYNLTVDSDDHSYLLANNIRTFNCFSADGEGVFQHPFIEAARSDYDYTECTPQDGWIYGMGIDWNSAGVGTQIKVVGYDITAKRYKIVDSASVNIDGWTQTAAVKKARELNRKWKGCSFIYVDDGYGAMQIEALHEIGMKAPKGSLDKNLLRAKPVNFSAKIEVYDPWKKKKVAKPTKPFMVNNAVRVFENYLIDMPEDDFMLTRQLEGYVIDHITPSNVPVYAKDSQYGDHALDALMLALMGFTLELSSIGKPKIITDGNHVDSIFKNNSESTGIVDPVQKERDAALLRDKNNEKRILEESGGRVLGPLSAIGTPAFGAAAGNAGASPVSRQVFPARTFFGARRTNITRGVF